jgi:colicin import membrane protein
LKAAGLHLAVAILLFASFSSAPEFEPAKPIVQATLVQLDSMSPAVTQTDQKIAGEAQKTAAPRHEEEAMEAQRQQQQAAEAARAAAAEKAREQAQAAAAAAERQAQAEADRKAAEAAAAAERRKVEEAKKAAEAEAARRAEAERKRAEEEARRKAQEEARRKAEAEAERKAAEAAEAAEQRRREQERQANERRAQEEAKARALSELLAEDTQYQMAQADRSGDQVAASYDDVIRRYVSQQWRRPPTARNGMVVEVQLSMLPTGQITDVVVTRSSGDAGFDQSAVQAVRNVGRIPEMQTLSRDNPAAFDRMYRQRTLRFKPEDLAF